MQSCTSLPCYTEFAVRPALTRLLWLQVATLQEAISTARNASRVVGIYIDIVESAFHNAIASANEETLQEDLVLNAINSTGGMRTSPLCMPCVCHRHCMCAEPLAVKAS